MLLCRILKSCPDTEASLIGDAKGVEEGPSFFILEVFVYCSHTDISAFSVYGAISQDIVAKMKV